MVGRIKMWRIKGNKISNKNIIMNYITWFSLNELPDTMMCNSKMQVRTECQQTEG